MARICTNKVDMKWSGCQTKTPKHLNVNPFLFKRSRRKLSHSAQREGVWNGRGIDSSTFINFQASEESLLEEASVCGSGGLQVRLTLRKKLRQAQDWVYPRPPSGFPGLYTQCFGLWEAVTNCMSTHSHERRCATMCTDAQKSNFSWFGFPETQSSVKI